MNKNSEHIIQIPLELEAALDMASAQILDLCSDILAIATLEAFPESFPSNERIL